MSDNIAPLMVFDLDGTLVDSARDLIPVLNIILERQNLQPVLMEDARSVIGHGAKAMISRAYELNGQEVNLQLLDQLFENFLIEYENCCAENTIFFDGAFDLMDRLQNEGWQFAICTNKLELLAKKVVDGLGQRHRFKCICGPDTFDVKKPDPQHILKTIELAGGHKDKAIMIGDSAPDAIAANAAGVPVLLADFGYSNIEVETLDNNGIFSHFNEVYNLVKKINFKS